MSDSALPFIVQAMAYDPEPGREKLKRDVARLTRRAQDRVTAGDLEGGKCLARLALRYIQALYPQK